MAFEVPHQPIEPKRDQRADQQHRKRAAQHA